MQQPGDHKGFFCSTIATSVEYETGNDKKMLLLGAISCDSHVHQPIGFCGRGAGGGGGGLRTCRTDCVCAAVNTHTFSSTHTQCHTHTYTHTHLCTHTHTHTRTHTRVLARTHARTHTHTHMGEIRTDESVHEVDSDDLCMHSCSFSWKLASLSLSLSLFTSF